jgi:hypothetical protein
MENNQFLKDGDIVVARNTILDGNKIAAHSGEKGICINSYNSTIAFYGGHTYDVGSEQVQFVNSLGSHRRYADLDRETLRYFMECAC